MFTYCSLVGLSYYTRIPYDTLVTYVQSINDGCNYGDCFTSSDLPIPLVSRLTTNQIKGLLLFITYYGSKQFLANAIACLDTLLEIAQ